MPKSVVYFLIGISNLFVLSFGAYAQQADSSKQKSLDSLMLVRWRWHWILYYDLHGTFTADALCILNQGPPKPQLTFYYNLDIKSRFALNGWMWESVLFNDYGFIWFVDSIHHKSTDHFQYKFSLSKSWKKPWAIDVSYNTQTVLFPGFQYQSTPQGLLANRYESYMSPGFIYLGAGLSRTLKNTMRFQIGLASFKLARLRDTSLFASRSTTMIAGIERGKNQHVEGGINVQTTCPLILLYKKTYIEGTALAFIPLFGDQYNFDLNMALHIKLWRFGRLTWRHQLQYNAVANATWQLRQWITLGAYLNNHLK